MACRSARSRLLSSCQGIGNASGVAGVFSTCTPWVMSARKVSKVTAGLLKNPWVLPMRSADAACTVAIGFSTSSVAKTIPPVR